MSDRRSAPRFAPPAAPLGRLSSLALPAAEPAAVCNASAAGLSLYLARPPRAGDPGVLELVTGPVALRRPLRLRVAHVRADPGGGFLAGCELDRPLTPEELRGLLGG